MSAIEVSIINASDVVSDAECRALTDALQIQVSRDFAPAWRFDAKLTFVPKGQKPAPGTWWLSILGNTDHRGVLGHHDLTPTACRSASRSPAPTSAMASNGRAPVASAMVATDINPRCW
jgi:hypothetical protein